MDQLRTFLAGVAIVGASVVAFVGAPSATQTERFEIRGDQVAVYNLVGEVTIEAGTGSAVAIEVTRSGPDANQLEVEQGPIGGWETLRVIYPADEIVYQPEGRRGRFQTNTWVREDGTFGDGDRDRGGRSGRHQVEIRSDGDGLEAHANLRIRVPQGQTFNLYLGAGEISATNVDGDIRLDGSSGPVTVTGARGALEVDVGSGRVEVTDASGDINIDTGSGAVEVSGVQGDQLRIDTGSGHVTASRVSVTLLEIDTGSGGIDLTAATAREVRLDTGSGSVDAEFTSSAEDIEIDTGSGGVTLTLPSDFGAEVNLETGSGGIELDFEVTVRRWQRDHVVGVLGDGNGRLTIDTGSGSIRILRG